MTCAAPIERTSPALRVLHTPVTSAPSAAAICTAYVPTPPAAPLTSTRCPARTAPTSRIPRRAVPPAIGTAAACSKVRLTGLGTSLSASACAYSANAPRQKPSTSSPCRSPRTFAPTASTRPAASTPATRAFGLVSPTSPMSRAMRGSPRITCQSYGLSAAACTRTSTSSAPTSGRSVSASRKTSGGPNRSWTIAFIRSPRVVAPCRGGDAGRAFRSNRRGVKPTQVCRWLVHWLVMESGSCNDLDEENHGDEPVDGGAEGGPPPCAGNVVAAFLPEVLETMGCVAQDEEPGRSGDARRGKQDEGASDAALDGDDPGPSVCDREPDVDRRDHG